MNNFAFTHKIMKSRLISKVSGTQGGFFLRLPRKTGKYAENEVFSKSSSQRNGTELYYLPAAQSNLQVQYDLYGIFQSTNTCIHQLKSSRVTASTATNFNDSAAIGC